MTYAAASGLTQRGPGDLPDLVVSKVDFEKVKSGTDAGGHAYWIFNAIVTVKNQGKGKAGACTLAFERAADPEGYYTLAGVESPVPELAPGAQTTVVQTNFVYEVSALQKYFRANVDPHDIIKESNEGNNLINVKALPGY